MQKPKDNMHARMHVSPHRILGILGPLIFATQSLDKPSTVPSLEYGVHEPPIGQGWGCRIDGAKVSSDFVSRLTQVMMSAQPWPPPTYVKQRRGLLASADQMLHCVLCSVGCERHISSFLHGKNLLQAAHAQQAVACGYVHTVMPAPGPIRQPIAM